MNKISFMNYPSLGFKDNKDKNLKHNREQPMNKEMLREGTDVHAI